MLGAGKAAVVLLALTNGQSVGLMAKLKDNEIQEISQAMAKLRMVQSEAAEAILSEFVTRSPNAELRPSERGVEQNGAIPNPALAALVTGTADDRLAAFLENEHP
ncbi:MAG: hypothetical protein EXQ91_08195 [Alphaproteobacteria bacterium]|nr:hypothetical protein [Alphaproteobacteria bacterium]